MADSTLFQNGNLAIDSVLLAPMDCLHQTPGLITMDAADGLAPEGDVAERQAGEESMNGQNLGSVEAETAPLEPTKSSKRVKLTLDNALYGLVDGAQRGTQPFSE
ncbi:hypothetical protein HGRIS_007342 [Hohenbuehelia grisea]|uniref:Uncharacterized protein n=1 Tax=Hohenbuehelia grisea TaxID=104357 RepID=A0ABR3J4G0_9AGAR